MAGDLKLVQPFKSTYGPKRTLDARRGWNRPHIWPCRVRRARHAHDGSPLVVLVPVVALGRPILVSPPREHARGDDAAGDEHESYQPKYR